MRDRSALLLTIAVIVAAACGGDTPVDPAGQLAASTAGPTESAARRDTARRDTARTDTTRRDTARTPRPPADTTPTNPVVTNAHVSGRVLGGTYNRAATGNDTLQLAPMAGTTVKLFHNRMVDGRSASVEVGQVVTGADGAFSFGPIPGGYYLVRAYPPAASGFGESLSYLQLTQAQMTMNVYVWHRPAGSTTPPPGTPADSTRRP
jgi:hypothetical protein